MSETICHIPGWFFDARLKENEVSRAIAELFATQDAERAARGLPRIDYLVGGISDQSSPPSTHTRGTR